MSLIPERQRSVVDKPKRFYVFAPTSVHFALQEEAYKRGTDLWTLCGGVLSAWLAAGCPDDFFSPCPSPSPIAKPD